MKKISNKPADHTDGTFFLSDLIGIRVEVAGKKIGKLDDLVIKEQEKLPEVTHVVVSRSFGNKSLLVPMDRIGELGRHTVVLDIDSVEAYEGEPADSQVLLKDHILDKKVIDLEGNDIDIVYDVKLALRNRRLYVTDVDFSKYGLLKRLGLRVVARFAYHLAEILKKETLSWTYVQRLPETIGSFKGAVKLNILKETLPEIHPVDMADILEELSDEQRLAVFNELETEHASDTLEEIEPRVQQSLISSLTRERTAELVADMTPAQAADVLAALPSPDAKEILDLLEPSEAQKIETILKKQEASIMDLATSHFIGVAPGTPAAVVIVDFRRLANEADVVDYLYVVSPEGRLEGVVSLSELLTAEAAKPLSEIMTTQIISLDETDSIREATKKFTRYRFSALPVTNSEDIIRGVVPSRDILDLQHKLI